MKSRAGHRKSVVADIFFVLFDFRFFVISNMAI